MITGLTAAIADGSKLFNEWETIPVDAIVRSVSWRKWVLEVFVHTQQDN